MNNSEFGILTHDPLSEIIRAFDEKSPQFGPVVSRITPLVEDERAQLFAYAASPGDLSQIFPNVAKAENLGADKIVGIGISHDPLLAKRKAIVEAYERYCTSAIPGSLHIASARELGRDAFPLHLFPQCADEEYTTQSTVIRGPSPDVPIRWVAGINLSERREVWIPALLAFNRYPHADTEPYWTPTSAGCAAHTCVRTAITNGLLEIVERDCIALTWLLQLALPEIGTTPHTSLNTLVTKSFDASLDHPIKCALAITSNPMREEYKQVMTAATAFSLPNAHIKALNDGATWHRMVRNRIPRAILPSTISQPSTTAEFMAHAERASSFDFLSGPRNYPELDASTVPKIQDLESLIHYYSSMGHPIFCVDLSTHEAKEIGLRVVRVIAPTLMPLSYRPQVRYLAHPRLSHIAHALQRPAPTLSTVNPWPIPFG